jgi:hypothetical protein
MMGGTNIIMNDDRLIDGDFFRGTRIDCCEVFCVYFLTLQLTLRYLTLTVRIEVQYITLLLCVPYLLYTHFYVGSLFRVYLINSISLITSQ